MGYILKINTSSPSKSRPLSFYLFLSTIQLRHKILTNLLLILSGQNLVPKPTCQSQTPSRGRNREDQNVCHRGRPASTSLRPRGPTSPTPVLPTRPRGPPSPSASIQRAPGQAPGDGRPFYADPHAPGIATFSGG